MTVMPAGGFFLENEPFTGALQYDFGLSKGMDS